MNANQNITYAGAAKKSPVLFNMNANQNITYASTAEKKLGAASNVAVVGIRSRPDNMKLVQKTAATESAAAKKNEEADAKLGTAGETWKKFTAAQKEKNLSMTVEVGKPSGKMVFKLKK